MSVCHLCGQHHLLSLLDFGEHPIAHRFLIDSMAEEAVYPVMLSFCESCGLIQLSDPIPPDELYTAYNWLSSWKWNPHIPRLVSLIKELPGLTNTSKIVEVGSNDGNFLEVLRDHGYHDILGVEPAQDACEAARQKGMETIGAYFTVKLAQELVSTRGNCDLFIARQVLEHITDLETFLKAMRVILRPGGYVLIEVPNFGFSLDAPDYSAIWEEHVNYFTLETLSRCLANAGVKIVHDETAIFSGDILIVLGEYVDEPVFLSSENYLEKIQTKALTYRNHWPIFRESLVRYLKEYRQAGKKVAVYGGGCRACSLINFAGLGPYIEFVVDDQPEKQDKYMPGSRLPILPGEALSKHDIDLCLLAVNAENEEKVIAKHRSYQENGGCFASILPPSDRLLSLWLHP